MEALARPARVLVVHSQSFFSRYRIPILTALGLRLATSIWLAIVWFVVDPYFPRTAKTLQETYNQLPYHESLLARMFGDVWLRWDAVHYMNLAWSGYGNAGPADTNYWPLYPSLVRLLNWATLGDTVFAGLLVSTISTLCAFVLFWELVKSLFSDERLANWSVIAWAAFPTSFFLVAPFTDSLFACLALAALLMMQKKRWLFAGILTIFGSLARSQGVLLIAAFVLWLGIDWLRAKKFPPASAILGLAISPIGIISLMVWRRFHGLPNIFSSFNIYTHAQFVDPLTGIFLAIKQLWQTPDLLMASELLSVLLFLGIQIWMLTRPPFQREIPLMAYGLLNILFNLTKHITNATPLQSSNRYVLNAIPAFIGIAWWLTSISPKRRNTAILVSISLGVISISLYALWIFIG